jgi:hypothetical protein
VAWLQTIFFTMTLKPRWNDSCANSVIEAHEKESHRNVRLGKQKGARWGAMDFLIITGIFLLGAGVGAATTGALQVRKIRHLKRLLESEHNNPRCGAAKLDQ